MTSHRVVFTPSGLSGDVVDGTTVLDAARRLGADLDTVCGGRGICGRCQVAPSLGTFAKWGLTVDDQALAPWTSVEENYHGGRPLVPGQRLGCSATILGDVVIDIPAASQVHRQVVRKDLDRATGGTPIVVDPLFALYYVEIAKADLESGRPASDLVTVALADQHGVTISGFDAAALRSVYRAIAGLTATVACRAGRVVAAWPGFVDAAYGIAVDIGSTTIAGHLCELFSGDIVASAGQMNPQIRFGEDLMSRVSYVMMNEGGADQLTGAVRTAVDGLIGDLLDAAAGREHGLSRDRVLDVVIVGNPIMHHLVLGIDPTPLGMAPFTLATNEAVTGPAGDLGLALPHASFYAGPCVAGHVGADTAAAVLAEGPHRGTATQLLVDIGTNAEIVLGNRDRLLAASSPTGPAFEGAQISCGQRATAGAVESVRIDPVTGDVRIRVIGVDAWSDEPGFDEAVASTGVNGLCGSGIIDLLAEMSLAGLLAGDGTILPPDPTRWPTDHDADRVVADGRTFRFVFWRDGDRELSITQNDVRAIQLAKAALRAGIELLLEHAGHPPVTDIRLAGAFGAHIDPYRAIVLGLVPDCPVDSVRSVGNAAGAGAVTALLSGAARTEMERVVREIDKIETATEPRFQELFVGAMAFPHGDAAPTARPRRRSRRDH